jgi:hypothetical protein
MLATMRSSIDYSLSKRRTLIALFQGSASAMDACDADPYLRRAAKLGQYSGRIKNQDELAQMQSEYGEFRVYVVEICTDCHWNHLVESFLLGDGRYRKPPRKVHTLLDDD